MKNDNLNKINDTPAFSNWNSGANLAEYLTGLDDRIAIMRLDALTNGELVPIFAHLVATYYSYIRAVVLANATITNTSKEFRYCERDKYSFLDYAQRIAIEYTRAGGAGFVPIEKLKPIFDYWELVVLVRQQAGCGFPIKEKEPSLEERLKF
jgi:hypothetical protein